MGRPWVCTDRWGGGGRWARDHGSVQTGGGWIDKRPWVCTDRWGDGQETMGLYRQVGGWVRDHGSVQTGGGMGMYRQVGG